MIRSASELCLSIQNNTATTRRISFTDDSQHDPSSQFLGTFADRIKDEKTRLGLKINYLRTLFDLKEFPKCVHIAKDLVGKENPVATFLYFQASFLNNQAKLKREDTDLNTQNNMFGKLMTELNLTTKWQEENPLIGFVTAKVLYGLSKFEKAFEQISRTLVFLPYFKEGLDLLLLIQRKLKTVIA